MTSTLSGGRVDIAAPWRLLRRRRDLRLLLGAGLVSMTGDWILGIGLTYSVYAITGSTLASAVTLLASFVPQSLAALVAGVFVDRWDRKRTMILANLLLAVGLVPLAVVDGAGQIWVVYLVLVWESVVEVFFAPAEQAMLPRVVDETDAGELIMANALNAQSRNLARLVGAALGGVAAAIGGIPAVAALDALTFVVATALLVGIRTSGRSERAVPAESAEAIVLGRFAELREEWAEGLRVSWGSPPVRLLLFFCLIASVGEGIMGTLFAPYVRSVLHGGSGTLGVISGVQAVGGIVGALVVATFGSRWSPGRMLGLGAVAFGLVDLAIFTYPLALVQAWPAVLGMILVGLPGAVVQAGMMTLFQQHSTDAQRGRVFALVMLAQSVAMVLGTTGAGFLGDLVGIVPILAIQGAGYVVAGSLVLVRLPTLRPGQPGHVIDRPNDGIYVSTAQPPEPAPSLEDLVDTEVQTQVVVALDRVHDSTVSAHDATGQAALGPDVRRLLDELSGSPVASAEVRWLHDRVAAGSLTWEAFWSSPHVEPGGSRLWGEVLRVQAERARASSTSAQS